MNYRARKENWPSQPRTGRGGGREYAVTALPKETQSHLTHQLIAQLPAQLTNLPAVDVVTETLPALAEKANLPAASELKKHQRETMDARVFFMRLIERAVDAGIGVKKALETIEAQAKNGTLPPEAMRMIPYANARKGESRTLSYGGMKKWWAAWLQSGKNPVALAPAGTEKVTRSELIDWVRDYDGKGKAVILSPGIPAWLPYFLDEYRRPQKPSVAHAVSRMKKRLPAGIDGPDYHAVKRLIAKLPVLYLEKGRMTGAEYKSLQGYAERDASEYAPLTVCQIDGHSFKAYVAHPVTGAHFHPEVCAVICLTTKVLVGWSAGLAESWRTVSDAYRHACTVNEQKPWGGVCAILEPDRGPGNMAKVNSDECIGIISRLGTDFRPPEHGGNPQGHGGIERSNQSIWIRAAKELPTYTGKDMDRTIRKKIYLKLEKDLKQIQADGKLGQVEKTSELLLSWREFLDFCEEWVIVYNNTPHRSLPKITAPLPGEPNGKPVRRHMTPFEAWAQAIKDGWQPVLYEGDMLEHLFMPHERVKVKREKITLHGNQYHAYELCHYHNQEVIAAYDIHDANQVWVLDLEERPICVAKFEGNKRKLYAESVVQQAEANREARRAGNLERKLEMVRREANRDTIEVAPTHIELPVEVLAGEEQRRQKVVDLAESRKLRDVSSPLDVYFMILDRIKAGEATAYQLQWKEDYEYWDKTKKKLGLFKDDEYCLKDPAEQAAAK